MGLTLRNTRSCDIKRHNISRRGETSRDIRTKLIRLFEQARALFAQVTRLGQTIGLPCAARLQQPASDVGPKISIEDAPPPLLNRLCGSILGSWWKKETATE